MSRRSSILRAVAVLLVAGLFLLPLAWMVGTSLAPSTRPLAAGGRVLPAVTERDDLAVRANRADRQGDVATASALRATLDEPGTERPFRVWQPRYWTALARFGAENYGAVWSSPAADFPLYLHNTLVITLLSVIGMVLSSAIVAFGFARLHWPGRDVVFGLVLATMMIPFPVIMAPLFVVFRSFGWIGSFKPLWVPTFFGGAFSIFLLRQFFRTIPRELDEAAMIDGCSSFGIFWRIILPLSKPALVVVALFQCIWSWNDFVAPLIFLNHEAKYTLALGLFMYESQHGGTPWHLVMAASVLIIAPVLVLFVLAQRTFVEGIATRGTKG